ncbi:MAG: hydrogenase maturation protease [Methylococcaceae bacterium]|nr:hydrogenase maturation protease [Methylococcaceae bacterium]
MMRNVLVFGYGNLSRGDDALGPLVIEYIENNLQLSGLEIITDFQLQIEHALDLEGRELVLFIDASVACTEAYSLTRLSPEKDKSYTTHAMSPASVLAVYENVIHKEPPPCFLLSIQGLEFELGSGLSDLAERNLVIAMKLVTDLLQKPELNYWLSQIKFPHLDM